MGVKLVFTRFLLPFLKVPLLFNHLLPSLCCCLPSYPAYLLTRSNAFLSQAQTLYEDKIRGNRCLSSSNSSIPGSGVGVGLRKPLWLGTRHHWRCDGCRTERCGQLQGTRPWNRIKICVGLAEVLCGRDCVTILGTRVLPPFGVS